MKKSLTDVKGALSKVPTPKNSPIVWGIIVLLVVIGLFWGFKRVGNIDDNQKLGSIKMIQQAFNAQLKKVGELPIPDDAVTITASGTVVGYQGKIKDSVKKDVSFLTANVPNDIIYFLSADKKQYQLMTFVSKEKNETTSLSGYIIVGDRINQKPYFAGDELGMLFEQYTYEPVTSPKTLELVGNENIYILANNETDYIEGNGDAIWASIFASNPQFTENKDLAKTVRNLVGYWSFDEGNGTTIYDHSIYQNHGEFKGEGLTWVEGGLQFGGNGRVEVKDSESLDLTGSFTISFVVGNFTSGGTIVSNDLINQDTIGAYNVYIKDKIGYEANNLSPSIWLKGNIVKGVDSVISIQVRASDKQSTMFLNGEKLGIGPTMLPYSTKNPILIGRRGVSANGFFDGVIKKIMITKSLVILTK